MTAKHPTSHTDSTSPWQRRDSTIKHTTPWFDVRHDSVIRPDGRRDTYMHVVTPGSVTVLAMDHRDQVMVTRQWIYTHGAVLWRLPSGGIDDDDEGDSLAAAHRELAEETGLTAARWELIGRLHEADSLSNHVDSVFVATDLTRGEQHLRPGEDDLETHWVPFDRVLDLVLSGELRHSGSAYAVLQIAIRRILAGRPDGDAPPVYRFPSSR